MMQLKGWRRYALVRRQRLHLERRHVAGSLAMTAGADDFLTRHVDRTCLCERVRALLNYPAVPFEERR